MQTAQLNRDCKSVTDYGQNSKYKNRKPTEALSLAAVFVTFHKYFIKATKIGCTKIILSTEDLS
jgi:hypothetical protein